MVKIYYDNNSFRYRGWRKLAALIGTMISKAGKKTGEINVIITNDEELRQINMKFLEHDYYTDVITFNYNNGDRIDGEIYISLDTVRLNAGNYKTSLRNEISRVIIHGVLHLLGYDDKSERERQEMRHLEDFWIDMAGKEK